MQIKDVNAGERETQTGHILTGTQRGAFSFLSRDPHKTFAITIEAFYGPLILRVVKSFPSHTGVECSGEKASETKM